MAMFAGPLMGAMAGPGNFVPHMMPTQAVMDQHAMRAYQNNTREATFNVGQSGNDDVATRLLGLRSAVTDQPVTQLNREQAQNMAGMLNNPITKALLGSAVGPENLEAMLHGSKGDVGALAQSVNKIGYFRSDPTGGGRMSGRGLEDYTKGVYDELYEPHGDLDRLAEETRKGNADSTRRLKKAARAEQKEIVSDDTASERLMELDDSKTRVDQLYKKYVSGGKATDLKEQAQALTKYDRALNEAGVLSDTEVTVGGLKKRAEKTATQDMHGFMASQMGQLAEDMFQRGKLPQALGSMSAADRVKLIQSSGRDDETMDKLAREYGHRELMKDTEYRGKTAEGQKAELESKLGTFKGTLGDTFKELDKAQKGEKGAKSVEQLEQLAGMDMMAGNVDAKRTASALKDMTGAVAAVRDIFGDNGNPNAPMPALLAALEHLTQGAGSQVSGGKVETALRQMQTLAKETGVGFEQLAGLSANMGGMDQMLGNAKGTTMGSTAHVLAATKSMRDRGAFANPVFGAMSQEEAMQNVAEREARGKASTNSMGMATLAALYDATLVDDGKGNKISKTYGGSEMEAAVKAYNDPNSDGTYTFTDPVTKKQVTKNIKEVIGQGGIQAAGEMFERAGGTQSQFSTTYYDPRTKGKVKEGFGFDTQKYEAARDINNFSTSNAIYSNMATYAKKNAGSEFAKLSKSEKNDLSREAGLAMTDLIIDTSNLEGGEQITKIQETMESKLQAVFEKRGHPNPAAAAKEAVSAMVGEDPDKQRVRLQEMVAGANAHYGFKTGGKGLVTLTQVSGNGGDEATRKEVQASRAIAERKSKFGGQEAGTMQSISDYLFEIAESGENFTPEGFMQAALKSIPDGEMRQKYAQEMTGGFKAVQEAMRDAAYTNKDIDAFAAGGDVKKIRELAGMTAKPGEKGYVKILDKAEMTKRHTEAVGKLDEKAIKEAYDKHIGDGAGLTDAQRRSELNSNTAFLAEVDSKLVQPGEMTMAQATQQAKKTSTGVAKTEADKLRLADLDKIQTSFFKGENEDKVRAGVSAAIRQFGALDMDETKTKRLQDLILKSDDASKEELQKELKSMKFVSERHRADFTQIATAQQAGKQLQLSRAGFNPETDSQLTPTPQTPSTAPPSPAAAAGAPAASAAAGSPTADRYGTPAGKKQTTMEWLLGLPGTQDVQQKKEDKPVAAPAAAPGPADTPEVAALKKEREAIQEPMTADDADMARTEAKYAKGVREFSTSEDPRRAKKALELNKDRIIAQRVAKKMGFSVRGQGFRDRAVVQNKLVKNDLYLGGKLLDPKLVEEAEKEFDDAQREGKSPYSPEAQKLIAVDEKIAQEQKKQDGQHAAAVKTANDQALVQQATGVAPAASKQDPAQQAFEEAENKRLTAYDNLSPAEQSEVDYYEERKQMDEWRKTANDPSKSPAEQSDARQELRDAQEFEGLSQQDIIVRRMAEDAGIDSSGHVDVNNGIPTIGGVALDPREFHKKRVDFEENMANNGDPLSTKSRAYALAAIDARKKERAIKKGAATKADEKADVAAKNDAELQQRAGLEPGDKPAADAQTPPAKKYDVDPSEFTQSESQQTGSYASIDGIFHDRNGKVISRPTEAEHFDAIHTVDRAKDDKQGRTGRVGQIGEKYYEQYRVAGVAGAEAWREVTVGKNEPAAQTAVPPTADSAPPTAAASPDKPLPAVKQASSDKGKPTASEADNWYTSITKKVAQVASAAWASSVPDAKQVSAETKNGVAAAQTTAITSRNVNPATVGGAGAGGEKTQKLTINGTLSLQGLNEAILNGRGSQPVAAEGAGSPIVVDPAVSPIDGMKPELP
jgi:hypothetical protein